MTSTAIEQYVRPASVEEAWAALVERGAAARPIGGGIDIGLHPTSGLSTLIDLDRLALSYLRDEDGLAIGAGTTFTEILESPHTEKVANGILGEVLQKVASPLQRNLATIGGTLGSAHPWSDVVPALLVLDARLRVYDGQSREISLVEYLTARATGDRPLIIEIRLPVQSRASAGAFEKYSSTGFDVATLNCACYAAIDAGRCQTIRIAVGGTPSLATRCLTAEQSPIGARLDDQMIETVAGVVAEGIDARDDRRSSAAYRRHLAGVGVSRCLKRIVGRLETMT